MSFFSELRWWWRPARAIRKAAGMSGRIYALHRHGRYQQAYVECIGLFDMLATVPAEYHHRPGYVGAYICQACELDDLCIILKLPPPCAELREALRMLNERGYRSQPVLAKRAANIERRLSESGCGAAVAR